MVENTWSKYNCQSVRTFWSGEVIIIEYHCECQGNPWTSYKKGFMTDEQFWAQIAQEALRYCPKAPAPAPAPTPAPAPAPPPAPVPPAPPAPEVPTECESVKWYDVPGALRCVWHSIRTLPEWIAERIVIRWRAFIFRELLYTLVQVMERAKSPEEWTAEDILNVTGFRTELVTPLLINAVEGVMATFLTGPNKDRAMTEMYWRDPVKLPGASDMVRFQLREVFDPDLRAQQLTPPPSLDFYSYMQALGFGKFWADSYWAAHWDLPSVSQAYEMYARLRPGDVDKKIEFNRAALEALLKRLDVLPAYIPQLIEIAYTPLTRVDIRRMYRFGKLTKAQVEKSYLDLKYSPTTAKLLADYVESDYAPGEAEKELSLSDMEKALAFGIVTDKQFEEYLKRREFSPDMIKIEKALEVAMRPETKATKLKELSLTDMELALANGIIDEDEFKAWLTFQNYSPGAIEVELALEKLQRAKKVVK